jgi:RNA polymerase sigma-32 factor
LSKFDTDRGTRFVTYASYWIRAYILNHVMRSWSMVGGGSGAVRSKMFFKIRRERARIGNSVGDGERADEVLADTLGLPRAKVVAMVRALDARDVSLECRVFGAGSTLGDTEVVGQALTCLDRRERYIVESRLMADRGDELSLAEIGRQLGVSRERARQLEARAKRKLKARIIELSRASGGLDVLHAA